MQEASIKAWRNLRQHRGEVGSLRPWFLSIVANECRMTRRRPWWSVVATGSDRLVERGKLLYPLAWASDRRWFPITERMADGRQLLRPSRCSMGAGAEPVGLSRWRFLPPPGLRRLGSPRG